MRITAIATDNLPNRNWARFPASELPRIAATLNGNAASIDHSDSYLAQWGTVVRAWIESRESSQDQLAQYGAIIQKEGYQAVMVEIEARDGTVAPKEGDHLSITTLYEKLRCPDCTCEEGDAYDCNRGKKALDEWGYLDRVGVADTLEISLVLIPAVKGAIVLSLGEIE